MADSWTNSAGSQSSLSQNDNSNSNLGHVDTKKDKTDNEIDSFMRPRSFSDASFCSFKQKQSEVNKKNLERKQSVKVIICRESKIVKDPERGRKLNQDRKHESASEKPRQSVSRSKSAYGRTNFSSLSEDEDDVPPPKPKLPESYRAYYFLQQFEKLGPSKSQSVIEQGFEEDEIHYFRSDLSSTEKHFEEPRTGTGKSDDLHASEKPPIDKLQRTENKPRSERLYTTDISKPSENANQNIEGRKLDTHPGYQKNSISSKTNVIAARGKKVLRSDSQIALYRSYDAKLRAVALKKELDTLRSSEHVRQRLSSSEQCDTIQPKKEIFNVRKSDSDVQGVKHGARNIAQTAIGLKPNAYHESAKDQIGAKTPFKEAKTCELETGVNHGACIRDKNEPLDMNFSNESHNTLGAFKKAFPPSGAHIETNVNRNVDISNQRWEDLVKKIDEKRRQGKEALSSSTLLRRNSRSKSESSLIRRNLDSNAVPKSVRTDQDSNQTKDTWVATKSSKLAKSVSHQSRREGNLQVAKPALVKRKQDTIRKFNYDSFAQVREKIRLNYQKKPERSDSYSPLYNVTTTVDTAVSDNSLSDNRSDEEKYAALSRSKILHSKSSSLDSHLEIAKKIRQGRSAAHPIPKPTSSSSLTDYRSSPVERSVDNRSVDNISSSSDSLEVYLSENKGVKHETFNTDIPPLPTKKIKDKIDSKEGTVAQSTESSTQQKIVLRQCRIGSAVAFGLVGLNKTETEVSWHLTVLSSIGAMPNENVSLNMPDETCTCA